MLTCVLGDAHIDVVVSVSGPVAVDSDTPASTSLGFGGQAANVAAWTAALGGQARLIAARGTDLAAEMLARDLRARGVELVGPRLAGRTGVVVALSDGQQRSMLTDRGVGPQLTGACVQASWLEGCDWLHLPGYSLMTEPVAGAALAAAQAAADHGARLSVDLSSVAALADYGPARFAALLARLRPGVVFGTQAEVSLITQAGPLACAELIVKLGAGGVRAGGAHYAAHPARAVDATGAGDAFAAGYLLGGVQAGLAAAARAVAKRGAMP